MAAPPRLIAATENQMTIPTPKRSFILHSGIANCPETGFITSNNCVQSESRIGAKFTHSQLPIIDRWKSKVVFKGKTWTSHTIRC